MANYPPPGQAHPDQPSDPWQGASPWGGEPDPGPYGQPSGYIGEQYSPAPVGYPAQVAPPVWGPPEPVKQGLSAVAIALLTALAVVVLGGSILGVYEFSGKDKTPTAGQSTGTAGVGSSSPTPARSTASPTPSEQDFTTAKVGQCLQNRGTDTAPELHIVKCAPGTYQLLKRFEDTVDENKCAGTNGLTASYHYGYGDTKIVYCLKKLS